MKILRVECGEEFVGCGQDLKSHLERDRLTVGVKGKRRALGAHSEGRRAWGRNWWDGPA